MSGIKKFFIKLIWRYFVGCREVAELASRELDNENLPWRKRISMRLHILTCQGCQNYLKHLRFMREVFTRPEAEGAGESSVTLSSDAKERLKNALKTADSQKPIL